MKSFEKDPEACDYTTWQVMQEYLPNGMLSEFQDKFARFDPEKTGLIRMENVVDIVLNMGRNISVDDARQILQKVVGAKCWNSSLKFVDFKEFIAIITFIVSDCVTEEEMFLVFQQFDRDGDGYISPQELRDLLRRLGDEISEDIIEDMIRVADQDGDGKVSYKEFVRVMTNSTETSNDQQNNNKVATPDDIVINETHVLPKCIEEEEEGDESCDDIIENDNISDIAPCNHPPTQYDHYRNNNCDNSTREPDAPVEHRSIQTHRRRTSWFSSFAIRKHSSNHHHSHFFNTHTRNQSHRRSCPAIVSQVQAENRPKSSETNERSKRRFSLSGGAAFIRSAFKKRGRKNTA